MIIDFDKITEEHIEGFKGGEGELDVRAFVDDRTHIMCPTLRPGANSRKHQHVGSFETMYAISGELTVHYDDTTEVARIGQLRYYPERHFHWFESCMDHDVVYLVVVPALRQVRILFTKKNIYCRGEEYFFL